MTWWECFHFFQIEGVDPELSGRLVRAIRLDGQPMTDTYEMWNRDLRITWREDARTAGASGRVGSISIAIPPSFSAEGQGIFGYLYGDDQFVGMTTMLDPHFARQGYAAASAFFQGEEIEQRLVEHDRWTIVVLRGDGVEVYRRMLPVPTRAGWHEAYLRHRQAIEQAWRTRDPKLSVADNAAELPNPVCLISTPEARHIIEMGEI